MNKIHFFSFLLLLGVAGQVSAQDSKRDSLLRLLKKSPEDTNRVNQYRQVGVTLIYENPPEALPYFIRGAALAKKLRFNSGMERCYAAASLTHSFLANYDSSLLYIDTALYYAHLIGNPDRMALLHFNRADIYTNLQNSTAALKDLDTTMTYAEKSTTKEKLLARVHSLMSDIYVMQKQYGLALTSLDKSQAFYEKSNDKQMIALNNFGKAEILKLTDQWDKAEPLFLKAIAMADSLQDLQNLSSFTSGLAQTYFFQKRFAEAEAMIRRSLTYAQQTGNRTQETIVYDLFYEIAIQKKNYQEALAYALKAYNMIKGEKDLLREEAFSGRLAEAYFKAGNSAEAYRYLKINLELKDSMVRQQYNNETAKLLTTFHVKQKDQEILLLNKDKELQTAKLKQQWLLIIAALILVALALLGIGLLITRYRLRQRMKELELRNRIAADLHDEVGSSISSIHMLSQVAAQQSGHDASHQDILNRVSTNARETMEKMGDIVWMIKAGENDGDGLIQRMERFMYEMCSSQNIICTLQGADSMQTAKLSMQQRKNFYLIFKEALNNAVKYSGTDKIDITIEQKERHLILSIKDYGKGFDWTGKAGQSGNGLSNMQNRAREMGGQLSIDSRPGEGTKVAVEF